MHSRHQVSLLSELTSLHCTLHAHRVRRPSCHCSSFVSIENIASISISKTSELFHISIHRLYMDIRLLQPLNFALQQQQQQQLCSR